MFLVDPKQFETFVAAAVESLPAEYRKHLQNVAIIVEPEPSPEVLRRQGIGRGQTLLGLYEGVPLSQRQGQTKLLPDKITLFQGPIERRSDSPEGVSEQVRHTIWHEVAHYYGLDHSRINELDS